MRLFGSLIQACVFFCFIAAASAQAAPPGGTAAQSTSPAAQPGAAAAASGGAPAQPASPPAQTGAAAAPSGGAPARPASPAAQTGAAAATSLAPPVVAQPYADETVLSGTGTPNATVTVQISGKAVTSASGGTVKVGSDGTFKFSLSAANTLKVDDAVDVTLTLNSQTSDAHVQVRRPSGLVGLMVGGAVFSQQAGNFSQSAPFFGFITGYRWHDPWDLGNKPPTDTTKEAKGKPRQWLAGSDLNLRFQGIFTLSPQTACTVTQSASSSSSGASGSTSSSTNNCTPTSSSTSTTLPTFSNFITSPKSFDMNMHMWWGAQLSKDFELGPYAAIGLSAPLVSSVQNPPTPTTTAPTTTTTTTTSMLANSNAKPYWETGALGEFTLGGEGPTPKLFMQTVAAFGKYQQLAHLAPTRDSKNRAIFKMVVFPTGLALLLGKQVELSPMLGVDINYGPGGSIVRFFTGAAVNLAPMQKFTAPSM